MDGENPAAKFVMSIAQSTIQEEVAMEERWTNIMRLRSWREEKHARKDSHNLMGDEIARRRMGERLKTHLGFCAHIKSSFSTEAVTRLHSVAFGVGDGFRRQDAFGCPMAQGIHVERKIHGVAVHKNPTLGIIPID